MFKHFERQLALFSPTPAIGVEFRCQQRDAVRQFGVLRGEGLFVDLVHQAQVQQSVVLIAE